MKQRALWGILAAGLLIRIAVTFQGHLTWYNTDSWTYMQMAQGILAHRPIGYFPNGYPLLIAFVLLFVPESGLPTTLIVINILLSTGAILLTYLIAERITGKKEPGLWAAGAIALYPSQLNYTRLLLSEIPCEWFLIAGVLLMLRPRLRGIAGVSLCIATAIRSTYAPVFFGYILLGLIHRVSWRSQMRFVAGFIAASAFFGGLQWLGVDKPSNNAGINLILAVTPHISGAAVEQIHPETLSGPWAYYTEFAGRHPVAFLRQRAWSLWILWGFWPGRGGDIAARNSIQQLLIGIRFPVLLLACAGLRRHRRAYYAWTLALPVLSVTIIHTLMFSTPRFTCPIEPLAIVLAVLAFVPFVEPENETEEFSHATPLEA